MLLAAAEKAADDAYELCRALDDADETEPCFDWYFAAGDLGKTEVFIL